jgi:peroxiredoxin
MKTKLFIANIVITLALSIQSGRATEATEAAAKADLQPVIMKIQEMLKAGKDKESDLAANIKELDTLTAKYKATDKESAAEIALLKAQVYSQVLDNDSKAIEVINQVKKDFAGTRAAAQGDGMVAQMKAMEESKKIQRSLTPGSQFPDFSEKDLAGNPLSVARFKGKVVLVDFWATWCGPCVHELPNVLEVYNKHHAQGFEIIGVSLDADKGKLQGFIKARNMPWPQFFDGKAWSNKLAVKYGIHSIPATYLLDREGKIIDRDLRGEELEAAVTKALASK